MFGRKSVQMRAISSGVVALVGLTGPAGLAAPPRSPHYRSPVELALAPDGGRLYVSCHTADTLAVIDTRAKRLLREIPVGRAPAGLAVSPDGRWVYVANNGGRSVAVVDAPAGRVAAEVTCGYEPWGLCLSPDGTRLYVANHISDDVSVIDTAARREIARVPVGRMPTFLALTPDGKRLLVSNRLSAMPATDPRTTSFVSVIDTATRKSVAEKKGPETMHVLQQVAVSSDGRHAYVVHLRPNFNITPAQLSQGWVQTNALTIIPLAGDEAPVTVLLDNVSLGAGNPYGVATSKDGRTLYVTHTGIRKLSVIDLAKLHALVDRTKPQARPLLASDLGLLWATKGLIRRVDAGGLGPKGLAVSPADGAVWVANGFSDTVSVLDAGTGRVAGVVPLGPARPMTQERRGEFLFASALHCFQNWLSCASCHPDTRADGVNWDLMNDGLTNPKNAKSLIGSWQTPPAMSLGVRASMEVAVEKGFLFIQFHDVSKADKDAVSAYLRSVPFIPSPFHRRPDGSLDERARRGEKVFRKAGCDSCHPAPLYTDKEMYDVGTRSQRDLRLAAGGPKGAAGADAPPEPTPEFDTPTLLELYRTGPYLHDGRAATLKEVVTTCNVEDRHGETSTLTPREIDDLVAFLKSL